MKISGLQKLTLLDFPGKVGAIVFLGGCNFRCPFCQNSSLVTAPGSLPEITPDEFRAFLKKRAGLLDGICVTGGEPTLHSDLPEFLEMIRDAGYLTKLDTNGTNPEMLQELLNAGLLDYVAMDIKAGRRNYPRVCGLEHSPSETNPRPASECSCLLGQIERSVEILKNISVEYEFRTTVVKGLHTEEDFFDIRSWISGCSAYYLQSFRDCPEVLKKDHGFSPFSSEEMTHFLKIVQKEIPQASLRGI